MTKWIPDEYLDLALSEIAKSDGESICNAAPTTYYNAVKGTLWTAGMTIATGDVIRPPTPNGFVYEAVQPGVTDVVEPGWGTVQDQEFDDGTTRWKTHENYSLAYTDLEPTDLTISDGVEDGRRLTVAEKSPVTTHVSGTVSHTALVHHETKKLKLVTGAETTLSGGNDVESGRTTIFFSFSITFRDPV